MKHRKETLTALLFLLAMGVSLCYLGVLALRGESEFRHALGDLRRDPASFPTFVTQAEGALNDDLDREHGFIQLYGGFQRLSGRRMLEDVNQSARVIKLSNGTLNFSYPDTAPLDIATMAQAVNDFSDALAAEGIPYLYVAAPQKIQDGREDALLPTGIRDYANDNADRLLSALADHGTDTYDLRPLFAQRADYPSLFFRTDHHWTPEAAFFAWQNLTQVLSVDYGIGTDPRYTAEENYDRRVYEDFFLGSQGKRTGSLYAGADDMVLSVDYGIGTDPRYTAEENYDRRVYEDFFLGSQGKRTGSLYAGADDITEYIPKFETDFTYASPSFAAPRTGPFSQSLLFPERVAQRDWFGGNPYTLYAGGDYGIATITNHLNPEGKHIVLLRESFSCALTPFLALSCGELTTIDLRYFDGDLMSILRELEPDLVMSLYCVSSISNQDLFSFQQADT